MTHQTLRRSPLAPAGGATAGLLSRLDSGEAVHLDELPTPSLLLDLDLFEANLDKMSRNASRHSIGLRPHAKTHKCPEIARRQVEAGALGACTATIHEAETLAAGGIPGLLITSEMVGRNKVERLVALTRRQPDTMSVVDDIAHARQLNDAAGAGDVRLNVLVDIDPMGRRTGTTAGNAAMALAEGILKLSRLNLRGVHSYSGASSHVVGFAERKAHSEEVMAPPIETYQRMKKAGMPVEILTGASTGTYNIDPFLDEMTEMQVGSYVFMDVDYQIIGGEGGEVYDDFAPALTVLTTVMSKRHRDLATLDAGMKAFATDRESVPEVKGISGTRYQFGGDEHGMLQLPNPSREIKLGDRLEFVVPHCDPTVNLYNFLLLRRGEQVEGYWPVAGRGHS
ncbi:MAG: DSD1 family PLP-dependent enzyme [Gammaproteobacteria bacterium]|nr:DSD1 family PLP-dependent enzyme [Gammaproteobacteria bacterium]